MKEMKENGRKCEDEDQLVDVQLAEIICDYDDDGDDDELYDI